MKRITISRHAPTNAPQYTHVHHAAYINGNPQPIPNAATERIMQALIDYTTAAAAARNMLDAIPADTAPDAMDCRAAWIRALHVVQGRERSLAMAIDESRPMTRRHIVMAQWYDGKGELAAAPITYTECRAVNAAAVYESIAAHELALTRPDTGGEYAQIKTAVYMATADETGKADAESLIDAAWGIIRRTTAHMVGRTGTTRPRNTLMHGAAGTLPMSKSEKETRAAKIDAWAEKQKRIRSENVTPLQWRLYNAARRKDMTDYDVTELHSTAVTALYESLLDGATIDAQYTAAYTAVNHALYVMKASKTSGARARELWIDDERTGELVEVGKGIAAIVRGQYVGGIDDEESGNDIQATAAALRLVLASISARQRDILKLSARGLSVRKIAARLGISSGATSKHIERIRARANDIRLFYQWSAWCYAHPSDTDGAFQLSRCRSILIEKYGATDTDIESLQLGNYSLDHALLRNTPAQDTDECAETVPVTVTPESCTLACVRAYIGGGLRSVRRGNTQRMTYRMITATV